MLDILLAFQTPIPIKWVSKKELFRMPFVGWILTLGRHIAINRASKNSAKKMTTDSVNAIKEGFSIMVFPEGTRSKGELLRFKEGAFKIAKTAGTDIIPFLIDGVLDAMPRDSWYFRGKGKLRIKYLDPVPYTFFKDMEVSEIADYFRTLIEKELETFRKTKT
jgi:1-acyl-sn-glycerol-3-phosphate acyltransferase